MQQTTIARSVAWRGIGLHGGRPAAVTVSPAEPDAGLVFRVVDPQGRGGVAIPAHPDSVHSTARATTLAVAGAKGRVQAVIASDPIASVSTVEHLLAALFALEIHNATIEVEGGEVPALDGSAAPFVSGLRRAGVRSLAAVRTELVPTRAIEIRDGNRSIRIEPAEGLSIDYAIDYAHPAVGRQRFLLERATPESFETLLAPARTFGFADEVEKLRADGLALGGDLDNTLVLGTDGPLNAGGLLFPDELARHKIVDLLGDLALLGATLHARVEVERGGHGLHHALVRALLDDPDALALHAAEPPPRARRALAQPA